MGSLSLAMTQLCRTYGIVVNGNPNVSARSYPPGMTTGLCTAAVTLTLEEIQRFNELPGGANEVFGADGCVYLAGHPGPHAFAVQEQDLPDDDKPMTWWAVWEGPEQPDSRPYTFMPIRPCPATREGDELEMDYCPYPEGHEVPHRWT